jgi:hypothetical protein
MVLSWIRPVKEAIVYIVAKQDVTLTKLNKLQLALGTGRGRRSFAARETCARRRFLLWRLSSGHG